MRKEIVVNELGQISKYGAVAIATVVDEKIVGKIFNYYRDPLLRELYLIVKGFLIGIIKYRYPLCCILQYTKEGILSISSALNRIKTFEVEGQDIIDQIGYVPCDRCMKRKLNRGWSTNV